MSNTKEPEGIPSGAGPGRKARGSPEVPKAICTCGHRASNHVAFKYACQAPGKRKGYCPCMRFIPRDENTGFRGMAEGTPKSEL